MLFTYKYITHEVNKLQGYLDYLFYNVWIPAYGDFNVNKLNGNTKLKCIYIEFGNIDYDLNSTKKNQKGKSAYFFNSSIEKIFKEFAEIDDADFKRELKEAYRINNNIDKICNNKNVIPITFKQIENKYSDLGKELKYFYSKLYGFNSPFNLVAFGSLNEILIKSHYDKLMKINNDGICPFCGINKIMGNYHSHREAYDHYLPKGIYPFSTINFKNLAPMCHQCNSSYKISLDPVYKDGERQLAFYPYSINHPIIGFKLILKTKDIENLKPQDIEIIIKSKGYDEQIESWLRVFGIEERYKAILCEKHGAKEWFYDVYEDFENARTLSDIDSAINYYEKVLRASRRNLKSVDNILKIKFLEECKIKGLFKHDIEKIENVIE